MQPKYKDNIKTIVDFLINPQSQGSIHCTGDTNTINIVKNELNNISKLKNEYPILKWIKLEPTVINNKEYFQILKVSISGRNNTWYQFKRIITYVFFPDGYPAQKPFIFFEDLTDTKGKDQVFEHVNVFKAERGRLCLQAIQKNYVSSMTLGEILMALERCIYEDNVDSPANGEFSRIKKTNPNLYSKKLNQQSEWLEWLEQKEIPQDEVDDY